MHSLFEGLLFFEYLKDYHVAFFALGNLFLSSVTWPFKHTKNCQTTDRKLSFSFLRKHPCTIYNDSQHPSQIIVVILFRGHNTAAVKSLSHCNLTGLWRNCRGWKFWHDLLKDCKLYFCVFAKGLDLMFFVKKIRGSDHESTKIILKAFTKNLYYMDGDLKRECSHFS